MVSSSVWKAVGTIALTAAVAGSAVAQVSAGAAAVAVTVNGVAIEAGAIEAEYQWIYNQQQMVHPVNATQQADFRRAAVDRVVVWELVRQKLAAAGQAVTGAEVDGVVAADRARIGDPFHAYIRMLGQDESTYRRRTEGVQNFKKYQRERIATQLKVSDEEIRDHYGKVDTYRSAEAYRVRYLQIHSFDKDGRLVHGDLPSVATRARKRVLEGAALEEVAQELTNTQVSVRVASGHYEVGKTPLYEPTLKSLVKNGDVSEVLKVTENSYLIFLLEEKVPAREVSLDQARPEIERLLLEVKLNEAIPGHVAGLKQQATITFVDPTYAPKE